MKFIDEYRDADLGRRLAARIRDRSSRNARLMEFCGGHTVTILRHGIRQVLPPTVEMLSGPGCPVCVTANSDLDRAIALAGERGMIVATFGDMLRVPGSYSSLQEARASGADVRVVYSALDAIEIARRNPDNPVVFLGIGFETTAPAIAASVLEAEQRDVANYFVLPMHKLCLPVIRALLESGEVRLDGLVCPGHVSAVIGSLPYECLPQEYGIACVISGFEPLDVLQSVAMLVEQIESGCPKVEIAYRRGVRPEGNQRALEVMNTVFEPCEADWRGIGVVPESGLRLREEYRRFHPETVVKVDVPPPREAAGCICGDILRGVKTPLDCGFFRRVCTPDRPVGPCMVSAEGSCAAYYHYAGGEGASAE